MQQMMSILEIGATHDVPMPEFPPLCSLLESGGPADLNG
jgi:hypothetical protein